MRLWGRWCCCCTRLRDDATSSSPSECYRGGLREHQHPETATWIIYMMCRLRIADLPCVCVYLHVCRYRLVPMGSFSKIIRTDDPNTAYELYGSQEFSLGKLFWYRRFDAVRVGMSTSLIWRCHVYEGICIILKAVSYTHLTLPTNREV